MYFILSRFTILILVSVKCLTADEIEAERSGWNINPDTQYHIQTDEGPERYFRFQTLNGQYRKEKRLEDGTVIGTEGWLDPLGYLRIKDYIADAKGFRILKSKMIYMGKDKPIQDAIAISKKIPANTGQLSKPVRPPNPYRQPEIKDISSNSIESNAYSKSYHQVSSTPIYHSLRYKKPIVSSSKTAKTPPPATTTIRPFKYTTPSLLSYEDKNNNNNIKNYSPQVTTKNHIYSSNYRLRNRYRNLYRNNPYINEKTSISDEANILSEPSSSSSYLIDDNNEDNNEHDQNHLASQTNTIRLTPASTYRGRRRWNGTTSSLSNNKRQTQPSTTATQRINKSSNRVRNTSKSTDSESSPTHDGTSITHNNSFQYYLKTHYHEEERRKDKSIGSFGYVDPFGIRRVIYYKADDKNGFQHKKSNRFVGHNAKPYD